MAFRHRDVPEKPYLGPLVRFEPVPGSWSGRVVACSVCGASGMPGDHPWMKPHLRGHAPCPDCGKWLTVKLDGTPRRHAQCPDPSPRPHCDTCTCTPEPR